MGTIRKYLESKLKLPKLKNVRNSFCLKFKRVKIFKELIVDLKYFQDLFHCSWMHIFLFPPYFLPVTLLGVQLPMVLAEISFEIGMKNLRFSIAAAKSR